MENIFDPVPINPVNIELSIIYESWSRLNILSDVNFTVNSPLVPCLLSSVNVKPTGILRVFCDRSDLCWEHVNNIPSRTLTNITKRAQYAVTRNFENSIQAGMDFRHCLFSYCFIDEVETRCMGFLLKGPWFTFVHTENGCGTSFALISKAIKI